MWRAAGRRLLVGLAMIPRGEVGLIFATIGLQQGVFGENVYASVLMVVLATTLLTPPLLRWRLQRIESRSAALGRADRSDAAGRVAQGPGQAVRCPGRARRRTTRRGDAGRRARRPPRRWSITFPVPDSSTGWPGRTRRRCGGPTRRASRVRAAARSCRARSWRFLSVSRVLERSLPDLAEAIREREADAYGFDPLSGLDWATLSELRDGARSGGEHRASRTPPGCCWRP